MRRETQAIIDAITKRKVLEKIFQSNIESDSAYVLAKGVEDAEHQIEQLMDAWVSERLEVAMPKIVAAVRRDEIGVGCGSAGNYKPCVCGSGDTVVGFVTNRDGSVKSYVCPQCAPWMKGGDE